MDIVFVILHYMAIEETKTSVEYIQKNIDTEEYRIVIVDNASPDTSGDQLMDIYQDNEAVKVLKSEQNIGFARGNNLGFRYAKKEWDPRYIVLMNNDVFLLENEFISKLDIEYQKSSFDVLGPMIMTGDGRCDINPQEPLFKSIDALKNSIKKNEKDLRRYKYRYANMFYKAVRIKNVLFPISKDRQIKSGFLNRAEDVKLHGCFLVFSSNYIAAYDGLDESTFLYWEEEFLYKHMQHDGKKMVYDPQIKVYHMEDASTDASMKNSRKKMMFIRTEYIKSLKALLNLYQLCDEEDRMKRK